jgi:hypothetical protein
LLPNAIKAGSSDFLLTVNGTNFQSNSWINFGTVRLAPQSVSPNTLRAIVPKLLISSSGIVPVTVTNPGNTGGTSRRVDFRVDP